MSTLDPTGGLDPASTVDSVGETVDCTTGTVGDTTGTRRRHRSGRSATRPTACSPTCGGLLDLDVNLDLDADAAAPISAAVAANANVAAPIDAAVSANVLSPDGTSIAVADQDSVILQDLDGTAEASVDQDSTINQGEVAGMRRRSLAVAALAAAACAVPGAAIGEEVRTQDNIAVAVTETDGAREFDFSWEVIRQRRGDVDSRNVAERGGALHRLPRDRDRLPGRARVGRHRRVVPRNQAVAINDQCTSCVVYAGARQFVRVVDEPARFTDAGRAILADVRDELRAIEGANLTVDEQIAIVEAQEARVLKVITEEVVPLAGEGSLMVEDRDDREADAD